MLCELRPSTCQIGYLEKVKQSLTRGAMTPTMLRQVWSVVETTQANILLKLDDASLVEWLLKQLKSQRSLDHHETDTLNNYLYSKLSLIRDLAQERQGIADFRF